MSGTMWRRTAHVYWSNELASVRPRLDGSHTCWKEGVLEDPLWPALLWSGWGDLNSRPLDPQLQFDHFAWSLLVPAHGV